MKCVLGSQLNRLVLMLCHKRTASPYLQCHLQEASVSDFCDLGSIFSSTCSAQDCKDSSEPPCKKQKVMEVP